MDGEDARTEATEFVLTAPSRKLSRLLSNAPPPTLEKAASSALLHRTRTPSLRGRVAAPSPLLRPSTAAATHSRIHQALRRSESEFVFSSKESTMDGLMYSSRFQQNALVRPASSQSRVKLTKKPTLKRDSTISPAGKSPPRSPSITHHQQSVQSIVVESSISPERNDKPSMHRSLSTSYLQRRQLHEQNAAAAASKGTSSDVNAVTTTAVVVARHDEAAYVQRKRRCARTFEEMICARIQALSTNKPSPEEAYVTTEPTSNQLPDGDGTDRGGIERLLANGIIPSLLALSTLSDQATQSHCCRSLYYLSRVHAARKPLVTHGVVTAIRQLARIATAKPRQDLAATLCHLCEETSLIEPLLFDGIDRCLVRLIASPHPETKRICALTVLNISSDASKIKNFVEPVAQLLITSTKSCFGHTAASGYLMKTVYNVARLPLFHASLVGENIPRFLAAQIPLVAHDIQLLALQALVSLCDAKTNRTQILSQAFCKLLETMLTITPHHAVQETTLLVILLLSQDDGSRIKLCNWIPVASLIQTATARLQQSAKSTATSSLVFLDSCILRNLCDSVLAHHELLEEQSMPLLLAMSRVSDHDIKSNAVCALVSIIASSPDESAEYVVDILDELITLARSRQPRTCLFAIGAVYNIACNDDCLPLLVKSSDLLDCLFELAREDAVQDSVAELVAAVLYRLLTHEGSVEPFEAVDPATLLLERGVLSVLVRLIRVFPTARPYAVQAVYLLAERDHDKQPPLFPHGSDRIWELVCALNHDDDDSKGVRAMSRESEAIAARSAVSLIAVLARQRVNHTLLVKHGAVFRFLKSLRRVTRSAPSTTTETAHSPDHDDETIVMNSAFVFYALAVSHEGCEQLIREQGIEELIYMARTTKLASSDLTHRVKELFLMTMCRVSSFLGLEVKLIEHGAIDAMLVLALVSSADSLSIKTLCIKTLANCLVAKVCARPLIDHGVIWALASLAVVDSPETRSACAVSLCNLAAMPYMLTRFLDAGAPRALVHMLQKSEHEPATALVVVKAMGNLVANEKLCLAFVNEDIEKHLSVVFASPASANEMRQLAAMVLLRVTSANDAVVSLDHLKRGVFVWMEQIITMEDDALVKNCMLTVHDLTCSTTIDVAELDVDHILRIVIQVFQRHTRSGDILTMCLWILYNLSCQLSVLLQLVRPEILAFLREQVSTATLPFTLPPATVPTPLITPSASSATLALNNTIALAAMPIALQLNAKLCCYILHNLSCAPDDTLHHNGVLASLVNARCTAILCDLYAQRDDLKETCAVAACNIAVGRVNSTRIVDDRAGDLVVHFVLSALFHRCHYRLVSIAVRKMVNAPGNRAVLVHRGITRAMVRVLELVVEGGCTDVETTRNLIASLCVLAKCAAYLPRLLQDGALCIVIAVSEASSISAGTSAMTTEILTSCFEILSELCSVDYEVYAKAGDEINVINTLTRLSELHQLTSHLNSGSLVCYYDRGDGSTKALAFAQLLTCMKKTPVSANAVKKNLELQATFQVPARKWLPDANALPREPPPLECCGIPLAEGSQSMPDDIKQRIKGLPAVGIESLVRDERVDSDNTVATAVAASEQQQQPDCGEGTPALDEPEQPARDTTGSLHGGIGVTTLASSRKRAMTKKQLQRGYGGRNLSVVSSTPLLL